MSNDTKKAILFDIERCSYADGPGIRTTVFFKGCNLRCAWCHNPEGQLPMPEMMFYREKCTGCGKCKEVCPHHLETCDLCGKCTLFCPAGAREISGKEYTVDEVFSVLVRDREYYDASGGGVTFSGGETMLQIDFLCEILKKCKEAGIHTAVDTAGHVPFSCFERILPYTDLFLYDVKAYSEALHNKYTGESNRLILENLKALFEKGAAVRIRVPVIPGVNDSEAEKERIKAFLSPYHPAGIDWLPYHKMGENKYAALGRTATVFDAPSDACAPTQ